VTSEVAAPIECRNAALGYIENPKAAKGQPTGAEGPAGAGAIESFRTWECRDTGCLAPDFETFTAENFGESNNGAAPPRISRSMKLEDKEGIRVKVGNMQLLQSCREANGKSTEASIPCFSIEKAEAERIATFPAELTPGVKNRKKIGIEPSELVWDAGAGSLNCGALYVEAFHKSLKFEGYENEELIATKDG
jgi:hypothetical protein